MEFIKHSKDLTDGRRITVAGRIFNNENGPAMSFGLAICKPGDVFVKRQARNKALGRAISNNPALILQLPAADRTPKGIRDAFHNTADELIQAKNEEINLRIEAGKHTGKPVVIAD